MCNALYFKIKKYRPADHYLKVKQSIQERDLTPYNPIICLSSKNSLWIIDGQNRFLACKELSNPIYYTIISDGIESDIMALNISQKNWSNKDYLNYYASKQIECYVKVKSALDNFPLMSLGNLISVSITTGSDNTVSRAWRDGSAKLTEKSEKKMIAVCKLFTKVCPFMPNIGRQRNTVLALGRIYNKIDEKRLLSQLSKYSMLMKGSVNSDMCLDEFELVYNYKKHDKISLRY